VDSVFLNMPNLHFLPCNPVTSKVPSLTQQACYMSRVRSMPLKSLCFCNQQLQGLSFKQHMIRRIDTDNMVRSLRMTCTLPQVSRMVTLRPPSPVAMLSHTASCNFEASPLPAYIRPQPSYSTHSLELNWQSTIWWSWDERMHAALQMQRAKV